MLQIIKTTGEIIDFIPKDKKVSLHELQEIVGGYIEIVSLPNSLLVCDEEGKMKNKPVNQKATQLLQSSRSAGAIIVGDVIHADYDDID